LARTIRISDEVYELLKRSKLPTESFSSVIRRNLRKGKISEITRRRTIAKSDWKEAKYFSMAEETTEC